MHQRILIALCLLLIAQPAYSQTWLKRFVSERKEKKETTEVISPVPVEDAEEVRRAEPVGPAPESEPTPEEVDAYGKLIAALCKKAKECARVVAEDKTPENEKFTMRVWLMGLGMMGKEYANARKQLSKNLTGDSSWRFGKPEKKAEPQEVTAPDAETIEGIPSTDELNRRRNRVTK